MYYGEELFLMSWLSFLTIIELHAIICNGHPTCINNNTPICTSKGLSISANLSIDTETTTCGTTCSCILRTLPRPCGKISNCDVNYNTFLESLHLMNVRYRIENPDSIATSLLITLTFCFLMLSMVKHSKKMHSESKSIPFELKFCRN